MAFNNKRKCLSGFYVSLLMHNIVNARNNFMFALNLSGDDEKSNILCGGRWINTFGEPFSKPTGHNFFVFEDCIK